MKYVDDLRRWQDRRRSIYEHWLQSRSLSVTGRAFGISRERVRQIVNREGKDAPIPADREILGGNGIHGEGHPPED